MSRFKKLSGIIAAIICVLVFHWMPAMGDLTSQAVSAAGIFFAAIILWVTEAFPMSVSTILMICLLGIEQIMPFSEAMENVGTNTSLFIMASSGLTVAVALSNLPQKMTNIVLKLVKQSVILLIIIMGLLISLCSAFMSSLATCALFAAIIDNMLLKQKCPLRKCMMMMIPACAGIGGFMSPAGTPANLLILELLSRNGIELSFIDWCKIGFPIGIITTLLFSVSALIITRPVIQDLLPTEKNQTKTTKHDIITLIIMILIIAGWFASSWIKSVSITEIAIIGLVLMFLPYIDILKWDSFSHSVNWDLVITMGTVSVLMTGIAKTGLIQWMAEKLLLPLNQLPEFQMFCILSIILCVIRAFIPTTTAVVSLLGPMLVSLSSLNGSSLTVLLMILAFWTASALLLVYTEPIYLITFQKRDYSAKDLFLTGLAPTLIMALLTTVIFKGLAV